MSDLRRRIGLLAVAAALLGTLGVAPAAAAPAVTEAVPAGLSPPGSNDWSCQPTEARPFPVVLVHGTFASAHGSWLTLSPKLAAEGYCVFALDYGNRGTGPIADSAAELAVFVDEVLAATGAAKVSMVGHSQGGMMPRYYLRFLDGAARVDELIGLAPSNHGTKNPLAPIGVFCPACEEQAAGSEFLTELNEGREVEPGVDYTVLTTRYDLVVVPHTSGYLAGPADQVTNITIQRKCRLNLVEHVLMPYDSVVQQWVLHALDRNGPAALSFRPRCLGLGLGPL